MPPITAPRVELVLREGAPGEVYNVGGEEFENIEVTRRIVELTGADPGADHLRRRPRRATTGATRSTTPSCAGSAGGREHSFGEAGLPETVAWYRDNRAWCEDVKSGEYRAYYDEQYGSRLTS